MRKYMADSSGNCLQCCLAGIFDLPLERVPSAYYFEADERGWYTSFYDWCVAKTEHIPVVVNDDTLDGLIHIEVVETERGIVHAMISRGVNVLHNPDSTHLVEEIRATTYRVLFVPVNAGIQRRTPVEEEKNERDII